ncbi:MAG TPA: hypothetical protein VM451_03150 [Candidatus Limnocylindria bacterium]|nr:hypothetical protein [Candidatus Limnocylindria bacterium]
MFDYQTVKLLHRHGSDDWAPYSEGSEHDSASRDVERSWLKQGARIFKCSSCADEVMVMPAGEPSSESSGAPV